MTLRGDIGLGKWDIITDGPTRDTYAFINFDNEILANVIVDNSIDVMAPEPPTPI